jgi:hypothetical protein
MAVNSRVRVSPAEVFAASASAAWICRGCAGAATDVAAVSRSRQV